MLLKISIIFDYTIFHFECGHFVSHFLFGPGLNLMAELNFKKPFHNRLALLKNMISRMAATLEKINISRTLI